MEVVKKRLDVLETKVEKLENNHENDTKKLYELDTSLQVFITEMKNISDDLKNVVANFKEAILRSTSAQEKEISFLKEQNKKLEQRIEALDTKYEKETIVANSEKWKNITSYILTTIISAVIGLVLATIGLK